MTHLPTTRRAFLRAAATLPAFAPLARAAAADEEALFRLVRREFPFDEARAPMNAANLCPSPRAVADRVSELTRDIDRDCSFQNRGKFNRLREEAREAVASLLGVSGDEVALVRNTSEANNIVNAGLELGAGDEVLVWEQNHPTNNVAWDVRAARSGFTVRRVAVPKRPAGRGGSRRAVRRGVPPEHPRGRDHPCLERVGDPAAGPPDRRRRARRRDPCPCGRGAELRGTLGGCPGPRRRHLHLELAQVVSAARRSVGCSWRGPR